MREVLLFEFYDNDILKYQVIASDIDDAVFKLSKMLKYDSDTAFRVIRCKDIRVKTIIVGDSK